MTVCDHAQLLPERTATLSRTDETHVRIAVTGPVGHPREDALAPPPRNADFLGQVGRSRRMRARLERFDESVGTDLGWTTVGQWDLPILGVAGPVFRGRVSCRCRSRSRRARPGPARSGA